MKIGIPTMDDNGLEATVSAHFGRAPMFTIIDMDTKEIRAIPNSSEHMGGEGKPPELLAKHGVDVMICSGLGPRAVHMFEAFGVMVYVGAASTVGETLYLFNDRKLAQATDENACKEHRYGH